MPLELWEKTGMPSRWLQLQQDPATFFDTVLEMTVRAMDVPAAMISAVYSDRQDIRAMHGRFGDFRASGELPLSHSLCKHVVGMGRPLVVRDALAHPLVKDSKGVRDYGVAAYAGEPLHDALGNPIGSLCVIDRSIRDWSEAQLRMISINAMIVERALNWPDGEENFPTD